MSKIIGQRIPAARFKWSALLKEFIGKMSALQYYHITPVGPLYIDPARLERGFVMHSHTGRQVEFLMTNEQKNAEGEIVFWEFVPTEASLAAHKDIEGVRVTILNS